MTPDLSSRNPHEASIRAAEEFGNFPGGEVASPMSVRSGQDQQQQYHQTSYSGKGKGRDYGLDENPYGGVVVPGPAADENHAYREYGGTRASPAASGLAGGPAVNSQVFWQGPTDEALHASGGAGGAAPEPVAHAYEYAQQAEMDAAHAHHSNDMERANAVEGVDTVGALPPVMGAVIPPTTNPARQSVALSEVHKQEEQAWRETEELRAVVQSSQSQVHQPVLGEGQSAERFAQEVTAPLPATESRPWEPLNIKRGSSPMAPSTTSAPAATDTAASHTATAHGGNGLELPLMPPRTFSNQSTVGDEGFHTPLEIPDSDQGQFPGASAQAATVATASSIPAPAPAMVPGDIHPAAAPQSPVVTSPTTSAGGKISAAAFKRGPRFSNNAAETSAVSPINGNGGTSGASGVAEGLRSSTSPRTSGEYLAEDHQAAGSPSMGGARRLPVPPGGAAPTAPMTKAQEAAMDRQQERGEASGLDADGRPRSPPPGYHNEEDSLR